MKILITESQLKSLLEKTIIENDMVKSTPNLKNQQSNQQKMLYDFLIGINNLGNSGIGWIPDLSDKNSRNAVKLTSNLLGKFNTYFTDVYGKTIKNNQPLCWGLYPLNPPKKEEGVSCYITNENGNLRVYITGGKSMAGMTNSLYGEYLSSPGVIQKALNNLKTLKELFQEKNR